MITWIAGFIILIAKLGVVLLVLLMLAAYLVWLERKFLARLQIRYGPNRAGKFGLLQPIADTIKMLTKEDIIPAAADRLIFLLAPAVVATTALMMFAVVPFGNSITLFGKKVPLVISDLNVGLLYVFALSSLGVYGVAMGGWASNSKYSLLGGIRGAAQMISYELALGLFPYSDCHAGGFLQHCGNCQGPGKLSVYFGPAVCVCDLHDKCHGRK